MNKKRIKEIAEHHRLTLDKYSGNIQEAITQALHEERNEVVKMIEKISTTGVGCNPSTQQARFDLCDEITKEIKEMP